MFEPIETGSEGCEVVNASISECSSLILTHASNNLTGLYTCEYYKEVGGGKVAKLSKPLEMQSLYVYVKGT